MGTSQVKSLEESFSKVQDPRVERTKLHKLQDIIIIAVLAVICGAETWVDLEQFGKEKQEWLKGFLDLSNGIASHDTFRRVFARLDPKQLEACFDLLGERFGWGGERSESSGWKNAASIRGQEKGDQTAAYGECMGIGKSTCACTSGM